MSSMCLPVEAERDVGLLGCRFLLWLGQHLDLMLAMSWCLHLQLEPLIRCRWIWKAVEVAVVLL